MKIHCLGTAGYHPNETRDTSCYFVPEAGLVFDAGSGLFRLANLIETDYLDILLSHAHLDHILGLTFLLDVLHQRPVETVRVWGDANKLAAIQTHLFSEHLFPVTLNVQWQPVAAGEAFTVGSQGRVMPFSLNHPGGSFGYRVDWSEPSASLAYVTDTTADVQAPYVEVVSQVDLLLHECNFRDEAAEWAIKTGHSWTSQVVTVAKTAGVKQLLLTHLNPLETSDDPVGITAARKIFPNTLIASDHLVVDF